MVDSEFPRLRLEASRRAAVPRTGSVGPQRGCKERGDAGEPRRHVAPPPSRGTPRLGQRREEHRRPRAMRKPLQAGTGGNKVGRHKREGNQEQGRGEGGCGKHHKRRRGGDGRKVKEEGQGVDAGVDLGDEPPPARQGPAHIPSRCDRAAGVSLRGFAQITKRPGGLEPWGWAWRRRARFSPRHDGRPSRAKIRPLPLVVEAGRSPRGRGARATHNRSSTAENLVVDAHAALLVPSTWEKYSGLQFGQRPGEGRSTDPTPCAQRVTQMAT